MGDFVRHGLPRALVDPWDSLLIDVVDLGKRRHGRNWAAVMATGPGWRFVAEPGVCGPAAVTGVLVPSADRVGRPYPLLLAASLPDGAETWVVPFACDPWFAAMEELLRALLGGDCSHESFIEGLAEIGRPHPDIAFVAALCRRVIEERTGILPPGASLWWSFGAEEGTSALVACAGLPAADRLASMLDAGWRAWSANRGAQP